MAIYDDVSTQIKEAMRARDKVRLTGLRGIRAALLQEAKKDGADSVSDETALVILRRLSKQRKESIDAYAKGGRTDLEEQERAELAVIETFLPQLADEATTRQWVQEAIEASGAQSMREMGMVMGRLMSAHKGDLDGGLANRIVRELLS